MKEHINIMDLNLKQLRNLHGYSLQYMANKLNITKQAYDYKEKAITTIKPDEISIISEVFNLPIEIIENIINNKRDNKIN